MVFPMLSPIQDEIVQTSFSGFDEMKSSISFSDVFSDFYEALNLVNVMFAFHEGKEVKKAVRSYQNQFPFVEFLCAIIVISEDKLRL
jgi:predicted CopG family antitoxin